MALSLDRAAARSRCRATPPDRVPGGQLRQPASQRRPDRLLLPRRAGPQPRQLRRARVRRRRRTTRATARTTCASAASRPGWCCRSRRCPIDPNTEDDPCDIRERSFVPGARRRSPADRRSRRHVADVRRRRVAGRRHAAAPEVRRRRPIRGAGRLRRPATTTTASSRATSGAGVAVGRSESARHPVARRAVRARDRRPRRAAVHRSPERQHDAPVHGRLLAVRHRADRLTGPPGHAALHRAVPQPVRGEQRRIGRRHGVERRTTAPSTRPRATCPRSRAWERPRECAVARKEHDLAPCARSRRSRTARTTTRRSRAPRRAGSSSWTGHAFVLQRSPPALVGFQDQYTPTDILETCSSPTFLDKYDSGVGDAPVRHLLRRRRDLRLRSRACRGW